MSSFKTEQEKFWAGDFGNEYTDRNKGSKMVASNVVMFSAILSKTRDIDTIIEFGPNRGANLKAIRSIFPEAELSAVEINEVAVSKLKSLDPIKIYHQSLYDFTVDYQRDFVLSAGLLIHINPEMLPKTYDIMYRASKRYICIAEYYNPTPVEIMYRGEAGQLFKRDFAGEMLDTYSDLQLVDYGFVYHRDNNFPQDDVNWFLLEKRS
ncbi:MAG: pseudaminic acid biosynthesis-associated methylase [Syntrophomonas sp.]